MPPSRSAFLERPATEIAVAGVGATPRHRDPVRRPLVDGVADRFPYLLDLRAGLVVFVGFALFALSPLGRHVDRETYLRPLRPGMAGFGFVRDVLDHIASQGGEGIVMGAIAVALTFSMRSSLPLLIAGGTELLFYVTGLVKLLFAKDAPRFGTPSYWVGGYVHHGKFGMAFPSGHTSEVVLVFGAAVLMLHVGLPRWAAAHTGRIKAVWIVVGVNAAVVSWAIGTHWLTDLIAGAIFGGLMLRCLVESVSRGYLPAVAARVDDFLSRRVGAGRPDRRRPPADPAHARPAVAQHR
jgi:hypothetical protein